MINLKKVFQGFSLKKVSIIIVITAIVTSLTTGIIIYNNNKVVLGGADWIKDEALQEFLKIYNSLDEDYYEDINKTEMVDAAISAMVDYLGEEYSIYLNRNETDNLSDQLSGKFTGIGVSIGVGNTIVKVYEDTPASRAGIEANDVIININSLIIDLRGNTGGYLKGATDIASMFVEKGKVLYMLENKDSKESYYDETNERRNLPVIVLIDGGSASASEVLAGALKDSYGATLVGKLSYGKGKVQQTNKLEDGSMVKYTIARWLRPNGECIDEIGIQPDYEVELEQDEEGNFIDTQLEKALELLS